MQDNSTKIVILGILQHCKVYTGTIDVVTNGRTSWCSYTKFRRTVYSPISPVGENMFADVQWKPISISIKLLKHPVEFFLHFPPLVLLLIVIQKFLHIISMLSGIFSIFISLLSISFFQSKHFLINQSTLQSDEAAVVIPLVLALSIPTIPHLQAQSLHLIFHNNKNQK